MKYYTRGLKHSISDMLRLAGIIAFGGWNEKYKQPKFIENSAQENLYQRFLRMVDNGKINEAENELLDYTWQNVLYGDAGQSERNKDHMQIMEMALCVYGYMNDKEDSFLQENGYSREEIKDGIDGILSIFGIDIPDI